MKYKVLKEMKIGKTIVKPGDIIEVNDINEINRWSSKSKSEDSDITGWTDSSTPIKPEKSTKDIEFNDFELYSTGSFNLDRALRGGLKDKSVVGIKADNMVKTIKFLKNLIDTDQFDKITSVNFDHTGIHRKIEVDTADDVRNCGSLIPPGTDLLILNLVDVVADKYETFAMASNAAYFGKKYNIPIVVVIINSDDERVTTNYTVGLKIGSTIKIIRNRLSGKFDEFDESKKN